MCFLMCVCVYVFLPNAEMFLYVHVYGFLLGTQTPLGDYAELTDKADQESAPALHSCTAV